MVTAGVDVLTRAAEPLDGVEVVFKLLLTLPLVHACPVMQLSVPKPVTCLHVFAIHVE